MSAITVDVPGQTTEESDRRELDDLRAAIDEMREEFRRDRDDRIEADHREEVDRLRRELDAANEERDHWKRELEARDAELEKIRGEVEDVLEDAEEEPETTDENAVVEIVPPELDADLEEQLDLPKKSVGFFE